MVKYKLSATSVRQYKCYVGVVKNRRVAVRALSRTHAAKILNPMYGCSRSTLTNNFMDVEDTPESKLLMANSPGVIFEQVAGEWVKMDSVG